MAKKATPQVKAIKLKEYPYIEGETVICFGPVRLDSGHISMAARQPKFHTNKGVFVHQPSYSPKGRFAYGLENCSPEAVVCLSSNEAKALATVSLEGVQGCRNACAANPQTSAAEYSEILKNPPRIEAPPAKEIPSAESAPVQAVPPSGDVPAPEISPTAEVAPETSPTAEAAPEVIPTEEVAPDTVPSVEVAPETPISDTAMTEPVSTEEPPAEAAEQTSTEGTSAPAQEAVPAHMHIHAGAVYHNPAFAGVTDLALVNLQLYVSQTMFTHTEFGEGLRQEISARGESIAGLLGEVGPEAFQPTQQGIPAYKGVPIRWNTVEVILRHIQANCVRGGTK